MVDRIVGELCSEIIGVDLGNDVGTDENENRTL
jgi:hypothetical protein